MKYHELNIQTKKTGSRVGRGIAAGKGKTAGRGTKGQGARKSGGTRPGFEGGQTPLYMRIPKLRGFKSKRVPAENVYTGQLQNLKTTTITNSSLFEAGLVSSPYGVVKVISTGELTTKKTVKLQFASAGAVAAIEKAGGTFVKTERQARVKKQASVE